MNCWASFWCPRKPDSMKQKSGFHFVERQKSELEQKNYVGNICKKIKMRKKIIYCEAMRRIFFMKMRIFPRKNGSDCRNSFLVFISNEQNFLSKNKNHNQSRYNLLFSYYHTETFKWHIFARAGNFWSHLFQTRLHMFFSSSVSKRQTIRFRSWKCMLTLFCVSSFRKKNVYTIMCSFSRYLGREYALFGQK